MFYESPAVETREPIGAPFVLGGVYNLSPTWADTSDPEDLDPA
jgi:hypothetical protein